MDAREVVVSDTVLTVPTSRRRRRVVEVPYCGGQVLRRIVATRLARWRVKDGQFLLGTLDRNVVQHGTEDAVDEPLHGRDVVDLEKKRLARSAKKMERKRGRTQYFQKTGIESYGRMIPVNN